MKWHKSILITASNDLANFFLKAARLDASFGFDGKLFHSAALLNEKLLCPLEDIFFGNLRSVVVRLRL